jgi:hypothetical protein
MLSQKATQCIKNYFNLPFKGLEGIRCPYFNNSKLRQRGQLRVLIGKGNPDEIVEEAQIISMQYHAGLFDKDGNCLVKNDKNKTVQNFLVDHRLGIECSGFVTHVLRTHFKETKKIDLLKKIHIVSKKRIFRWLISRLRPIENIDVKVYSNNINSTVIVDDKKLNYNDIQAGDFLILLETGPTKKRNHIILITDKKNNIVSYVHARAWESEGKYNHGVAEGFFKITTPTKKISEQDWHELGKIGQENETYLEVRDAQVAEIRRLIF